MKWFKSFILAVVLGSINILAYAAEPDAPKVADLLDKVTAYTKQIIDAAVPVAKKAYEIGLMTLQIDAAASLVYAVMALLWFVLASYLYYRVVKYDMSQDESNLTIFGGAFYLGVAGIPLLYWGFDLFSVWLWIKLTQPDLWLAHMAIEKLVNH